MNFNGHQIPTPPGFSYPQYIVKYKANGSYDWSYFSNDITCTFRQLVLANDNTLYYTGALLDSLQLGNFSLHQPAQISSFFISRLDSTGHFLWAKQSADSAFSTANLAGGNHTVVTKNGALVLLVQSRGYNDWGNGIITNSAFTDYYTTVVVYDKNGNTLSAKQAKADYTVPQHIVSSNNNIWVTGNVFDSTQMLFDAITTPIPALPFAYYPFVGRLRIPSSPTAIAPIEKQHEFSVFPNPASHNITISTSRNTHKINLRLIDNVGKIVGNYEVENRQRIAINNFAKGLYFAIITDGSYQEVIKLIIE